MLDNTKDITIYARGNATIDVFEKDKNVSLATFYNISNESWHKIY